MPSTDTSLPPVLARVLDPAPARVWRRAVALLLDTTLAGTAAMVIFTTFILPQNYPGYDKVIHDQWHTMSSQFHQALQSGSYAQPTLSDDFMDIAATAITTTFMTLWIYFSASEAMLAGATLGKRVFGLRAARLGTGEPPLLFETLSRCAFKSVSLVMFWPLFFAADAIPVLFNASRRAGHDFLARTIVTGAPLPQPTENGARDEDDDY